MATKNIIIHAQPVRLNPNICPGKKGMAEGIYGRAVVNNNAAKNILNLLSNEL